MLVQLQNIYLGAAVFFYAAPASVSTHRNKKEMKSAEQGKKELNQP